MSNLVLPPLDVEAALDLILALPAHRSHNENHAAFGKKLLDEYLVGLRARYKDDPVASRYLDNLFAYIASAVRAFSVEQDIFRTRWEGLSEIRKTEIERAKRLDAYSPFTEGNNWKKAFAILTAVGITIPAIQKFLEATGVTSLVLQVPAYFGGLVIACVMFLFLTDWLVFRYKGNKLASLEKLYPADVENVWRKRSIAQYRVILRDFLLSALILRENCYPSLPSIGNQRILETYLIPHVSQLSGLVASHKLKPMNELLPLLDEIISRHMAYDDSKKASGVSE